jgi:hypothetical protein
MFARVFGGDRTEYFPLAEGPFKAASMQSRCISYLTLMVSGRWSFHVKTSHGGNVSSMFRYIEDGAASGQ